MYVDWENVDFVTLHRFVLGVWMTPQMLRTLGILPSNGQKGRIKWVCPHLG